MRADRGATYYELLIAMLLTALGVAAIFSIWGTALNAIQGSHERAVAGQLARADLEKAKMMGYGNLPMGTTFTTGTYTRPEGSATSVTYSGTVTYFDSSGNALATTAPVTQRRFSVQRTVQDVGVNVTGANTYEFKEGTFRIVTSRVRRQPENTLVEAMATILVSGGI